MSQEKEDGKQDETSGGTAPVAGEESIVRERRVHPREMGEDDSVAHLGKITKALSDKAEELNEKSQVLRDALDALERARKELDSKTKEVGVHKESAALATARLARLQNITAALSNTMTQDGVAEIVLREAVLALGCEAGAVVVKSNPDDAPVLVGAFGILGPIMKSFESKRGEVGPFEHTVDGKEGIFIESFYELLARYPAHGDLERAGGHNSWIFLPLDIGGGATGALIFSFLQKRHFGPGDRHFALMVARSCAQALGREGYDAALTEAREAREMAEKANGSKSKFIRSMGHELRTPLNAINGYAEILEQGIRGPVNEKQLIDLGRIRRAASYLLSLVGDVMTVARLEAAHTTINIVPLRVNPALIEMEGLCALQARQKNIKLKISRTDPTVMLMAEPERLQQVLINLITNGIKYTAEGGEVSSSVEVGKDMIYIHVADTGRGIKPEDHERIFEPFVQVNRDMPTGMQAGVGLGLAISRDLARAMDGDITVMSTPGEGSVFTLSLPTYDPLAVGIPTMTVSPRTEV